MEHQHLHTTQRYACIYDETLYKQFSKAMASLEAIAVEDWPRPEPAHREVVPVSLRDVRR